MLTEQRLQRVLQDLKQQKRSTMVVDGQELTITLIERQAVLIVKTPVYSGDNYIPASVRGSLSRKKFNHTFFSIDEDQYEISLQAEVGTRELTDREFEGFISEFCTEATLWKARLDDHGRNDLVYIHAPR